MSYIDGLVESDDNSCPLSIRDLLVSRSHKWPSLSAILAPDYFPLNYAHLFEQTDKIVRELNEFGIGRNDRIGLALPDGPELALAFLAITSCATTAPLNPAYRLPEFEFYLPDLGVRALLVQFGVESQARLAAKKCGIPIFEMAPEDIGEGGSFHLIGSRIAAPRKIDYAKPEDIAVVLHTSGTTSRPKIVPLTHTNICVAAHNISKAVRLNRQDRCLNVMPLYHIHGISALLSSLVAGGSVVCSPGFYPNRFFEWVRTFRPTWYTASPTIHQSVSEHAANNREIIELCPLRFLRSASAAMPTTLISKLEEIFRAPFVEAYGMSEAAPQIASNPLPLGLRKLGSVGLPAGPEVAIMDDKGEILPTGRTGEVVIRGRNVMSGYERNPDANQSAYIEGWLRTGDLGYLDEDGYLFIKGRIKEIINRGGEKISPREIEDVLHRHSAIADVVAFALPDPNLGEEVAVAVIPKNNMSVDEHEVMEFAAQWLADFKIPKRVVFVEEIPKGKTGKIQRIGLAEELGMVTRPKEPPADAKEFTPPKTAVEHELAQIFCQVLNVDQVSVHDNFFDMGGYSLLMVQVHQKLQQLFKANLSIVKMFQYPTISSLARFLTQELGEQPSNKDIQDRAKRQREAITLQKRSMNES